MTAYKALFIQQSADGNFQRTITQRDTADLPANEVLIRVQFSSLNFKDAMSAHGNKAVTREFPHQGGIDAAGIVEESASADFKPGDKVIVTGYDLGMNTPGGLGQPPEHRARDRVHARGAPVAGSASARTRRSSGSCRARSGRRTIDQTIRGTRANT